MRRPLEITLDNVFHGCIILQLVDAKVSLGGTGAVLLDDSIGRLMDVG